MSGSSGEHTTVNPNLAALMRVIEDNQSKMPEGEYLVAMNALCALHRVEEEHKIHSAIAAAAARPPPSYRESVHLFAEQPQERIVGEVDYHAWRRVTRELPDYSGVSLDHWMTISEQDRTQLLREATESIATKFETQYRNPDAAVCPFIARHSVGSWRFGTDDVSSWTCVCG